MRTRAWPVLAAATMLAAVLVGAGGSGPGVAAAAQGDLDPGFAATGQAITDLSGQHSVANGLAVQPDGAVVTVGTTGPAEDPGPAADIALLRYAPDGTPDPAFGTAGVVTVDLNGDSDDGRAVAVQADGRIVVVGSTAGRTQASDLVVLRFEANGAPDPTFAGDGSVELDIGGADEGLAVAIQPDQKIVVGGIAANAFALVRLMPDGALDSAFDSDGIVLTGSFGGGERVTGVAVQPDGKIVGVGPSFEDFAVFRRNADGSTDDSFGNYGFTFTDLGDVDVANAVMMRPEETIMVVGRSGGAIAVARYDRFGFLDDSFGGGTEVTDLTEGPDEAFGIVTVGFDELIVAGVANGNPVLVAYEWDGPLFTHFGDGGVVRTGIDGAASGVVRTPDGRFVVAGRATTGLGVDSAVLRHHADGALDDGFGEGGIATTDIASPGDEVTAMALDGDGRIVTAGHSGTGGGWDFAVARFEPDGAADPTFGVDGKVTTDLAGGTDRAYAVAVGALGIVVAGDAVVDGQSVVAVARYRAAEIVPSMLAAADEPTGVEGDLDPSFGDGGVVLTDLTPGADGARAVTVLLDGSVVVAGFGDSAVAVVRYLPDGTLDAGFGDGGVVLGEGVGPSARGTAVAVLSDGRVVVAGDALESEGGGSAFAPTGGFAARAGMALQAAGDRDIVVLRYLEDGLPDDTFGDGGSASVDVGGGDDQARALGVYPDGGVLVAGRVFADAEPGVPSRIGLVRLMPDGSLNLEFGSGGRVVTPVDGGAAPSAVHASLDGSIVVGGRAGRDLAAVRYVTGGDLDAEFGVDGVARTDLGGHDEARGLAVRPDGAIVAAGVTRQGSRTRVALARYGADGALDPAFGARGGSPGTPPGTMTAEVVGDRDEARAVAATPDGKVVVAGEALAGPAGDFAVVRYGVDGRLDPTFGVGGRVVTDLTGRADGAFAVAVQPDGAIVVAGDADRGVAGDFAVARYLPDGQLDGGFGDGGTLTVDIDDGSRDQARALAIQPDGAIVLVGSASFAGSAERPPSADFAVARLTPTGTLDEGFAGGGGSTTDFDGGDDAAAAVAVRPDGRLVVAGSHSPTTGGGAATGALAGYGSDGTPDDAVGGDGTLLLGDDGLTGLRGIAVQPDGKLVAAGRAANADGVGDVLVLRLGADATPDGSFAPGGPARFDLGAEDTATAVALQPDGAVVVAATSGPAGGSAVGPAGGSDAVLLRLRADGVADPRFGDQGVAASGPIPAPAGYVADAIAAVAVQPDGNLVTAGSAASVAPGDADVTVLRFLGGEAGPVGPPADLAISMVASAAAVPVGGPLRYQISVRNDGPAAADAVTVTDELPAAATLVGTTAGQGAPCSVSGAPAAPTELTCVLGDIPAGGVVALTVTVQPTELGQLTNTARVRSDQHDPDPSDDSATVTTTVAPPSAIRANPGVVPLGRVVAVLGTGFPPNTPVAVGLRGTPSSRTVTAAADGTFTAALVVFAETTPGPRVVDASTPEGTVSTNLLVVTDSLNPPNFVGRS